MIDPLLSLAFSIHSNKGIYALLLGSGVSRSAGIPTGWEIVLDLIRKLSLLEGEDCGDDPEKWYYTKYKKSASYSELLDSVAKTSTERNKILRAYFEPSQDELEQGLKVPTNAHKAMAALMASGYFKVVLTTNFDRLLEKALEEIGITPTVISTPDSIEGVSPLIHLENCIVKIHGDYLDMRLKNTVEELSSYDVKVDSFIDRIFDEFGLIVCGWSAEWDTALRSAIERCKSHRFTTYWAIRGKSNDATSKLIKHRRAESVKIRDADSFFQDLHEKILSLQELDKPHPLSSKIAQVTIKKFLVNPKYKIRLHDLVIDETEKVYNAMIDDFFTDNRHGLSAQEVRERIAKYESITEVLQSMFIVGAHWGEKDDEKIWIKCLERLANHETKINSRLLWRPRYVALFILYSACLSALANNNYERVFNLSTKATLKKYMDQKVPLLRYVNSRNNDVIPNNVANYLHGIEKRYTALSDHFHKILKPSLKNFVPDDENYDILFDRLEFFLCLIYLQLVPDHPLIGRFYWHNVGYNNHISAILNKELDDLGESHPIFKSGLYENSLDRLKENIIKTVTHIDQIGWD